MTRTPMTRTPTPSTGSQGLSSFRHRINLLAFLFLTVPGCISRNQPLSHEHPWPADQRMSAEQMKSRQSLEETLVPAFSFSGTLMEAINQLMAESKNWTPDGQPIGGFIVRDGLDQRRITIAIEKTNALELIDALAASAGGQWTMAPYAIEIRAPSVPSNP